VSNIIGIDIGYAQTKIAYKNKLVKFPTAISFANDIGMTYGEDNVYDFEGDKYYVGAEAVSGESFTTTNFKFLLKFAPLIIYHILKKFDEFEVKKPIEVRTGLALGDWENREEFIERIKSFEINGEKIEINPVLIPQGAGVFYDYVHSKRNGDISGEVHVIDIGGNTINSLHFSEGRPVRQKSRPYPGHGVISILRPFADSLEKKYMHSFSEQEAQKYLLKGKVIWEGQEDQEFTEYIKNLKIQFVKKLFNSVLEKDKKILGTSDLVIIGGGGTYFIQDSIEEIKKAGKFLNYDVVESPAEYANVRGYVQN